MRFKFSFNGNEVRVVNITCIGTMKIIVGQFTLLRI